MTAPLNLIEFFAECTDFELCDALAGAIEDYYGAEALHRREKKIPHERWVIHSVWKYTGFFDCEGYSYFWGTNVDHLGFAEALEEIGFPILAKILRDYVHLVPREALGDWDAVEAHSESEEARDQAAEHMDDKLINEHPEFVDKTAQYARARRESFSDLLDRLVLELHNHREMFSQASREMHDGH